jgi:hypothetical protein
MEIFGPNREKVTGDRRNLHKAELHDFYYALHVVRVIKYMRMRWARNVARVDMEAYSTGVWWGESKEK